MNIFIKYIKRSMFENKGRLFLLILAVALSAGLLVVSLGTIDIIGNSITAPMKAVAEGKDIAIISNTSDMFFELREIDTSEIENIDGEIRTTGIINNEDEISYINVIGKETYDTDSIIEGSIEELDGNDVVVSKRILDERVLQLGDTIEFSINGELKTFRIAAISGNEGLFYSDREAQFTVITGYDYLADLYDISDEYNYATANSKDSNYEDTIKSYNEINEDLAATKLYDDDMIQEQLSSINSSLYCMFAIVILISIIIIYGAFKLTITERLSTIGTFFSQGASHAKVEGILFFESLGYGLIGGVIGAGLGMAGLYTINYFISPLREYGIVTPYSTNLVYPIIGFAFALLLSFVSALLPVRSIRKIPEKDIILNNVNESPKNGWIRFIVGILFLALSVVCNVINADWTSTISIPALFLTLIGLAMVYKKIAEWITLMLAKLVKGRFNTLFLALNNVRTSKVLLSSMMLVIISLASALLISSVGASMVDVITEAYEELNYDVNISNIIKSTTNVSTTDQIIEALEEIAGVDNASINPIVWETGDMNGATATVTGVEPAAFAEYVEYLEFNTGANEEMYDAFESANQDEVIASTKLLSNAGKKVGDTITLTINDVSHDYKVIGEFDGKLLQGGIMIILSFDELKESYNITEASTISILTSGDDEQIREKVTRTVKAFGATTASRDEEMVINVEQNNMIVVALSLFSYIAIAISAIGILNNITIGFLQRKREFAVLSSIGMSSKKRIKLLIMESIIIVLLSCLITIPAGWLMMGNMTKLMLFAGFPISIAYDYQSLPMYCLGTAVIILVATIPVLFKSRKIGIVEELKYE